MSLLLYMYYITGSSWDFFHLLHFFGLCTQRNSSFYGVFFFARKRLLWIVILRVCLCVDPHVCACLEPTRAVGAEQGFMMKFRSNEVFAEAKWEKMGKKRVETGRREMRVKEDKGKIKRKQGGKD